MQLVIVRFNNSVDFLKSDEIGNFHVRELDFLACLNFSFLFNTENEKSYAHEE